MEVYVATSMFQNGRPFGSVKRKQAGTRERRRFSENAQFKTFCVQRRLHWYANFVTHTSYVSARAVAQTHTQTHRVITVTLAHAPSVNNLIFMAL